MSHHDIVSSPEVVRYVKRWSGPDYTGLKKARRILMEITAVGDAPDLPLEGLRAQLAHTGISAEASWAFATKVNELCDEAGLLRLFRGCRHENTRNLYDQRPRSEGRRLVPAARICEDCGTPLSR